MNEASPDPVVRVLIVDDEVLVRESFKAFFSRQASFDLVGEACDGPSGIEAYERLQPDVVLMDLHMPKMNGIEATTRITRRWPDACIVALTTFGGREFIVPMLRAGAAGYLVKHTAPRDLLSSLRSAMAGEMPLSADVRRELAGVVSADVPPRPEVSITSREKEVLEWLAHGLSNAQIAEKMHFSEGSVKQYLTHVGSKLDARSRTRILVKAIQKGLIDPRNLPDPEE